jgi:hypothetical protein
MKVWPRNGLLSKIVSALVVVLALGAISVASASAASPEFKRVSPLRPVAFTVAGSHLALAFNTGEVSVCNKVAGAGTLTGAKTGNATLTLSECGTMPHFCYSKGSNGHELKSVELEVIPVYTAKAEHRVGIELRPKVGTVFSELTCLYGNPVELRGSIIAEVSPINSASKVFGFDFSGSKGIQSPSKYENEKGEFVNSWLELGFGTGGPLKYQEESWEGKTTLTTAETIEITG